MIAIKINMGIIYIIYIYEDIAYIVVHRHTHSSYSSVEQTPENIYVIM